MVEEKLFKKEEQEKEIRKNNQLNFHEWDSSNKKVEYMDFFIPLIAINFCLLISQNCEFLNDTFFQ